MQQIITDDGFIFSRFEQNCKLFPDHPAVIYLGEKYSFAKLKELIDRFATALAHLDLGEGDRVILYTPNCVQWVVSYLGLQKIGAVPIPISPRYKSKEINHVLTDCGAKAVICQDTNFGYVNTFLAKKRIQAIIVTNLADLLPLWKRVIGFTLDRVPRGRIERGEKVHLFSQLIGKFPPDPPFVQLCPQEHVAQLLYTGGTTDDPKGVPGTHACMVSFLDDVIQLYGEHIRVKQDVLMLVDPLFHIMVNGIFLALGLNSGCTTVLMPITQSDAILEAIQRHQATIFLGVPDLYRILLENDRLDSYDLSSLRICLSWGNTLPKEIFDRWALRFKVKIFQVYGSTEVGIVSMSFPDSEPSPLTVGRILPSWRFKIVDPESLQEVNDGEIGELWITSEHMLKEYWNNPEETKISFIELDGEKWYRMGDFVQRNGDEIRFIERFVDLIRHKGYRISASEIESVLQEHPAVVGACVVGIPEYGVDDWIKALVVLKHGVRGVGTMDLLKWCQARLAAYKIPRHIEFSDTLPKSKLGKLLRREVRYEEIRRQSKDKGSRKSVPIFHSQD